MIVSYKCPIFRTHLGQPRTLQDGCDRFLFPRECAKGAAAERASVTLSLSSRVSRVLRNGIQGGHGMIQW